MSTKFKKAEIAAILRETKFEYHRVSLPYGLYTRGPDRSPTRDLIFPETLRHKTVLDVGCAIGYFCFEAEAKGAQKVIGVELNETRFNQALILRDILDSNVEFIHGNILDISLEGDWDYVLLLNVIHHSPEPMRLIRYLAELANERLIVEFPTFADPKFRKHHRRCVSWICDRLPVIGVSSLQKRKIDQTFVFSPRAMERILTDHLSAFTRVSIIDSPFRGRKIAICTKSTSPNVIE